MNTFVGGGGGKYKHICASLLEYKDSQWLIHERSKWVPFDSNSARLSVLAGRTGTRCNVGRPQPRWQDGLKLALEVKKSRTISLKGNNVVSIGTRIRNSVASVVQQVLSYAELNAHSNSLS